MTTLRSELEWFWYLKRNPDAEHPFVEGLITHNCANCNKSLSQGQHNNDPIKPASLYERGHFAKTDCSGSPIAFCPADGYQWPCPEAIKETEKQKQLARIDRLEPPGHTMSFDAGTILDSVPSCDCQRQQTTCTCGYPLPPQPTTNERVRIGDLPDGSPHFATKTGRPTCEFYKLTLTDGQCIATSKLKLNEHYLCPKHAAFLLENIGLGQRMTFEGTVYYTGKM